MNRGRGGFMRTCWLLGIEAYGRFSHGGGLCRSETSERWVCSGLLVSCLLLESFWWLSLMVGGGMIRVYAMLLRCAWHILYLLMLTASLES